MILNSLLDRSSVLIFKVGMPLVFAYHALFSSVFFTTSAADAHGLEKAGNTLLAPTQFLLDGKQAIPLANGSYLLRHRFDTARHFFLKTSASFALVPFTLPTGAALKGLAYLSPEVRQRAHSIATSKIIRSNLPYYESIGLDMRDAYEAGEMIAPPKILRKKGEKIQLGGDLVAVGAIADALKKYKIPFWLDCGTALGAYRHGGVIPHDWDIDMAIFARDFQNAKHALERELDPKKFAVQDWSGRGKPETYLKVLVRASGGLIDIYNYGLNPETKQLFTILSNEKNVFLPKVWRERDRIYTTEQPFTNIFPLKLARFEGILVPVPGNIEDYLHVYYGENLDPVRVFNEETGKYEKVLDHPYWQLPYAH